MRAEDGVRVSLLERDGHLMGRTSVALVSDHTLAEDEGGQRSEGKDVSTRALYGRRLPETMDGRALARGYDEDR